MNRRPDTIELLAGGSSGMDRPAASGKAPRPSQKHGKREEPGFADTLCGQLVPPGAAPAPATPTDPAHRASVGGKSRATVSSARLANGAVPRPAARTEDAHAVRSPLAASGAAFERSASREDSAAGPRGDRSASAASPSPAQPSALEDRRSTRDSIHSAAAPATVPLAAEGGLEGAVLPHAAHLRVESGLLGQIELHVRVRDGVAHVRLEGPAAIAAQSQLPELRSALAREGLALGEVEITPTSAPPPTPAQAATGGGIGSNGEEDRAAVESRRTPAAVESGRARDRDGRRRVVKLKE